MLKALRSSPRVLRPVLGLTNPSLLQTRFSGSDSSDGPGSECVPAVEETQSKSAAPVAATVMRVPLEIAKVLALPLAHKPLFPGSYIPTYVKDAKLLAALSENLKGEVPYVGAFLVKADPRSELSGLNIEKKIYEFKGKDLFNRLHEVGTLAQIIAIQGDEVVLMGHKRLRITEMVSEDPLMVKVDHLKNSAYNMDDDVIKATYFEVVKILKDVMKTHPSWRDLVEHIGDLNYPRVADFAATVSFLDKLQCQQVLEELDVYKRLILSLDLLEKEMGIYKIHECIVKEMEYKIIIKELGVDRNDKTALIDKFRARIDANEAKIPPHVLQVMEEEMKKLQDLKSISTKFINTCDYLGWFSDYLGWSTALPPSCYSPVSK